MVSYVSQKGAWTPSSRGTPLDPEGSDGDTVGPAPLGSLKRYIH